ncbi:response regulator transcription factor [Amnibacterium kyonggiense]|uniref:DNA-binding response OmpR family regulator n=1 Tax=Amnibacterium kyonggiense TaxID=595671 RepID=A0A4R7FPS2_9MICO|nr:response regulator transcription factor [Amnibacterium kyonggiense]TDS79767.1 DNA-binding response OmpR family regulator [Amnibacterium kyonggiense]
MPSPARVLVVEDDALIRESVAAALERAGFSVHALPDGTDVARIATDFRPDLALLDVMLPGPVDGLRLARSLRRDRDVPVIFLTARDSGADRLAGFGTGADDYIVKPFIVEELIARVRVVLRRLGRVPATMELGDLVIDEQSAEVVRGGVVLDLTATEYRLLGYLARERGRILSKTQLLTQVWGYDDYDANLVEVHVSALRRKLEEHGPRVLHTVRGFGYVLRPIDRAEAA